MGAALSQIDQLRNFYWENFRPSERMSVVECAERYRVLSPEASEKKGLWDTSIVPYTRMPMDLFTHPDVREIILPWASQTAKSEVELNCLHWTVVCDPGPTTVSYAQKGSAEDDFATIRLEPMIRDSKILPKLFFDGKQKGYKRRNKKMFKSYIGGYIRCIGTSEGELSSRPTKYFFFDELSRSRGYTKGGSIFHLGKKRTQNYYGHKIMVASSPGDEGSCPTWDLYEKSRRYDLLVPCPHCKEKIKLVWEQVRYQANNPESAYYECQKCKVVIRDEHKPKMLEGFEWFCLDPEKAMRRVAFHVSALYSPWVTFAGMVADYLDAEGDHEKMRTFVNTNLGLPYKGTNNTADSGVLVKRREAYRAEAPEGVLYITTAVDINDFGFALETVGWGHGEESWSLDYRIIHGSPSRPEIWKDLAEYLKRRFRHEWGMALPISAVGIDTGYLLGKATDFIKAHKGKRVFGLKGDGRDGLPIVANVSQKRTGVGERKIPIFPVGVNEAKLLIYDRLNIEEKGPEYCHFPFDGVYNQQYFKELTSELVTYETNRKGDQVIRFIKPDHLRNEPLDTRVYNLAVVKIVRPHFPSLENRLIQMRADIENALKKGEAKDEAEAQKKFEMENAPKRSRRKPAAVTLEDIAAPNRAYKPHRRRNFNW